MIVDEFECESFISAIACLPSLVWRATHQPLPRRIVVAWLSRSRRSNRQLTIDCLFSHIRRILALRKILEDNLLVFTDNSSLPAALISCPEALGIHIGHLPNHILVVCLLAS